MSDRPDDHPAKSMNRRSIIRVLLYCGMLVIVVIAMQMAGNPQMWSWLSPADNEEQRELAVVEIQAQSNESESGDATTAAESESPGSESDDADPAVDEATAADDESAADPIPMNVTLAPELVTAIREQDRALGILADESDAYWQALSNVDRLPAEMFHAASKGEVEFSEIVTSSPKDVGGVFTIRGRLRRLQTVSIPENSVGIDALYEGWMSTPGSRNNPWRLLFTRIPEGMDTGEDVNAHIEVTGYYYRLFGYKAVSGLRLAPLLIVSDAKVFPLLPTMQNPGITSEATKWAVTIVGVITIAAFVLIFIFWLYDRRYQKARTALLTQRREAASQMGLDDLDPLPGLPGLELDQPADEET